MELFSKSDTIYQKKALLKNYYAHIHTYVLYGLIDYGSTFSTYLKKLTTLQSKRLKVVKEQHLNIIVLKFLKLL